ncbi:MAG: alpha/beta fold hydrolase [Segniliparus sp.]|uniref:alpha/beta fold hydrolase n=1 Tax=Segniliparus sp. TaxID=2804064 RepID=UPI003F3C3E40
MDVILIPGFWLAAQSWAEVVPSLLAVGHRLHPLTLPGLASAREDRSGIGLRDHVGAVVRAIDALPEESRPVLVGHSGGGPIGYGAVDTRPDRVARMIYVDSGPLGEGGQINTELPATGGEIPLPEWDMFEEADLIDLTDEIRARFRRVAIPEPAAVASDRMRLRDERRLAVPATVICCEIRAETLREAIRSPEHPLHGYVAELAAAEDYELVDLPTGHWPQFTRPGDLGELLVQAIAQRD